MMITNNRFLLLNEYAITAEEVATIIYLNTPPDPTNKEVVKDWFSIEKIIQRGIKTCEIMGAISARRARELREQ